MNNKLRSELLRRMDADQRMRSRAPAGWDPAVDDENTRWLKGVIAEHGWPGRTLVGDDGARAAWLLAQHADRDPEFQRSCLKLLEGAVAEGEADAGHLGYLVDRVAVAAGRPQTYGTQFGPGGPQPIADRQLLDERRASVGLGPFAEYERQMRELRPPGASPDPGTLESPSERQNGR